MMQDAFDLISAVLLEELLFIISTARTADILSPYEIDMGILLAFATAAAYLYMKQTCSNRGICFEVVGEDL